MVHTTKMRRSRGGFTLVELLVVVGIIILASAMALPAINQFLKGQKLQQAGRLVQSAFSEARRSAITQRSRHWIFFGRIQGAAGNPDIYGLAHYREGRGWEPTVTRLPSSIQPLFGVANSGNDDNTLQPLRGCQMRVQDWTNGLPSSSAPSAPVDQSGALIPFADTLTLAIQPTVVVYEFRKDGTILLRNAADVAPNTTPVDIYDLNRPIDVISVTEPADLVLKQIGEPSKRCFIDVDPNTGRVRFRVAETQSQDGTGNNNTR